MKDESTSLLNNKHNQRRSSNSETTSYTAEEEKEEKNVQQHRSRFNRRTLSERRDDQDRADDQEEQAERSAFLKSHAAESENLATSTSISDQSHEQPSPELAQTSSLDEPSAMNSQKRKRSAGGASGLAVSPGGLLARSSSHHGYVSSGIGKASFIHALVVIFLEFFAWGLLTDQAITVLKDTFPNSTFLANGLIHGLKGLLSFLSAPLIGAMSDIWGRKVFLLITVFFTCLPIPLMRINPMWYFATISISGLFAVTFSVVFAYVADVTDESNRTTMYGLVSATFAASLITSPALGSYLSRFYSENFVVALATAIAVFDLFFILVAVPESLPEKIRERSKGISWDKIDPFKSLRVIFKDRTITLLCITVFLSYLPEAGQYSCFFVYLKLIVGFSQRQVASFIAYVGILSCIAQAAILVILIRYFGSRQSIIIGLTFQVLQLGLYAFAAQSWLIWFSGMLAAISSIGYPAISAYISNQSHVDQQGVSQGMVTGIRGLCNGIGPALYGFIFWVFRVDLNEASSSGHDSGSGSNGSKSTYASTHLLPGPPFLFGSMLALIAIFVTWLIPPSKKASILLSNSTTLSSKYHKDNTLVKIGNTSSTYNRSSSSSSIAPQSDLKLQGASANEFASDTVYSKADFSNVDEIEHLLVGHHHHQTHQIFDQLETRHNFYAGGSGDSTNTPGGGSDVIGGGVLNLAYSSSSLDKQSQLGGDFSGSAASALNFKNLSGKPLLTDASTAPSSAPILHSSSATGIKSTQSQQQPQQSQPKIKLEAANFVNISSTNPSANPATNSSGTSSKFFNYHQNTKLNLD